MKTIPLSQGLFAMVNDADYEAVNAHKWYAKKNGHHFYAWRKLRKPDGTRTTQSMHQFLMPGVSRIDHRDGNGLNNQRHNLRPATHRQNAQGFRRKRPDATSQFRGVCWSKRARKWQASINVNGKDKYLGYFDSEIDAARAFDVAARKYRGEFAHLNFPVT